MTTELTKSREYLRKTLQSDSRDVMTMLDAALATFSDVTMFANRCMGAEGALALWAAWRNVPCAMLDGEGPDGEPCSVMLVRPLGELGPEFRLIRAVRS